MVAIYKFEKAAPSVVSLRKKLRDSHAKGHNIVVFERGEQYSKFENDGYGRWRHYGNGLLRAGYRLSNLLDAEWYEARDKGVRFQL